MWRVLVLHSENRLKPVLVQNQPGLFGTQGILEKALDKPVSMVPIYVVPQLGISDAQ